MRSTRRWCGWRRWVWRTCREAAPPIPLRLVRAVARPVAPVGVPVDGGQAGVLPSPLRAVVLMALSDMDRVLRETYVPVIQAQFDHARRVRWALFGIPSDPNPMPRVRLFWWLP